MIKYICPHMAMSPPPNRVCAMHDRMVCSACSEVLNEHGKPAWLCNPECTDDLEEAVPETRFGQRVVMHPPMCVRCDRPVLQGGLCEKHLRDEEDDIMRGLSRRPHDQQWVETTEGWHRPYA